MHSERRGWAKCLPRYCQRTTRSRRSCKSTLTSTRVFFPRRVRGACASTSYTACKRSSQEGTYPDHQLGQHGMIAGTRFVFMLRCQFDQIVDGVIGGIKQPRGIIIHGPHGRAGWPLSPRAPERHPDPARPTTRAARARRPVRARSSFPAKLKFGRGSYDA